MSVSTQNSSGSKPRGNPVLSPEEVELGRRHAEERDWGVSKKPVQDLKSKKTEKKARSSRDKTLIRVIVIVIALAIVIVVAVLAVVVIRENARSDRLATAQRELQGYADQLNKRLPADNQVVIDSVVYGRSGDKMVVNLTQGNTVCTAPVNAPDDKHNLYWVPAVDPVKPELIKSAEIKCIISPGFPGMGAN